MEENTPANSHVMSASRLVSTKQSPHFKAFFGHHPVNLTLDTGAEISMIKTSIAKDIGAIIKKSNQTALQADGLTPLKIIGETHLTLSRGNKTLKLEALVVNELDVDILAGIPFMTANDVSVRPAKQEIIIDESTVVNYGFTHDKSVCNRVRRTQAYVLRSSSNATVIWPGNYIEVDLPSDLDPDCTVAIETHVDSSKSSDSWLTPSIIEAVNGKIRIVNNTTEPQALRRHEHFCQIRATSELDLTAPTDATPIIHQKPSKPLFYSEAIKLDPDHMLSDSDREKFQTLTREFDDVFSSDLPGYNGGLGNFKATINMGPVEPPQRKGRVPQYSRDKLVELQQKFDELERLGVFCTPEEKGVTAEYLNPSFLVKKASGGFRLVTAFADVGRYSKPQPSLMPDVDSTLRSIAQWKYIIQTDLTNAFYQIPLSKASMKYCGVATPFRGVRIYTRCAMGMPGSETALEELMCRVLGDCIQKGIVAKLADDLYCGGYTINELLYNWRCVLESLNKCSLKISPSKTIICPRSTTILGWIWSQGSLSASPHHIAVLAGSPPPDNVRGLRSFIGAYKVLGRVLPGCSYIISPLENAIAGLQSQDKILWNDSLLQQYKSAQSALSSHKAIALPRPNDQIWIVTDASVTRCGIGSTLYVSRGEKLLLAGFFSAKLRKHQVNWLPCEVEALCIAASVKHFSPYLIQSKHNPCILTDSKPCVQAFEKLCRGEFSASPRVTSFLSVVSRYQVSVRHLNGSANIPSDFASRNAPECHEPKCQICNFIIQTEDSVVRSVTAQDVINNMTRMPFATRSAWLEIQSECPDLRRTHAHLKQGTRPSKKLTNIKDVKRYLSTATIGRDGLLVVAKNDPLTPGTELIIVPRSVLHGLVTALHIKLNHPSKHQLLLVMKRHFYALDLSKAVDSVCDSCHICASLLKFPNLLINQSSEDPPETVGLSFAADVIKRNQQLILLLREVVTSYTAACFIENEKQETLRDGLLRLILDLHPLDGPCAVVRVDPAPGFIALRDDTRLQKFHITLEIGRIKNVNKNPVAEKAILELEEEVLKQEPGGGPLTHLSLAIAVARLNTRIRNTGLSAREFWTQRNQYTHEQIPISDQDILEKKYHLRAENHPHSENSKHRGGKFHTPPRVAVGDLVYLISDKDKLRARNRYLVTSVDGDWCFVKKFVGNQLRASSYKVKRDECYLVLGECDKFSSHTLYKAYESEDEEGGHEAKPPEPAKVPPVLTNPSEAPILLALPEPSTSSESLDTMQLETGIDLSDASHDLNPQPQASEAVITPQTSTRPKRQTKRPKYLEDYVL